MTENKILQCIVVDDEPHAAEILELYIDKTPFLQLIEKFTDPWKAVSYLKENRVDILFLDVQMEGLTGLQLLDVLENRPPVILTTAYEKYAIKGYEYKIEDYLLKPYSFDRFLKAVNGVKEKSESELIEDKTTGTTSDHILVKGDAKNKFHRISINDILYIEGLRNYVQFVCIDQTITTLQNLKKLESELPTDQFSRVHKSFIININQVKSIEGSCVLISEKHIPIGASYKAAFLEKLQS